MPSVADILVQELLASLKPAVEDAVQRALGGSSNQVRAPSVPSVPQRSTRARRTREAAKSGVYIVATSRGRLPDWLKAAAKVDQSSEVSARWPKGTELRRGAPLPPFSAKRQKRQAPKTTTGRKGAAKKAAPVAVPAAAEE